MSRAPRELLWLSAWTPPLFGFDFASKAAARAHLSATEITPIVSPWRGLVRAENPGGAFSTMLPLPLLVLGGIAALALLVPLLRRLPGHGRLPATAVALVLAGGLGNLLDRIGDGTVTDMIRVSAEGTMLGERLVKQAGTAAWPIFNLVDVWLVVGVATMPRRWMEAPADLQPAG